MELMKANGKQVEMFGLREIEKCPAETKIYSYNILYNAPLMDLP